MIHSDRTGNIRSGTGSSAVPGDELKARREKENHEAALAAGDPAARERFLAVHETRILKIAGKLTRSSVTKSDDAWSVSLLAVSEALDSWTPDRGGFWPYAAVVMKSRLTDLYRQEARSSAEISVRPEAFDGEVDETDPDLNVQMEVRGHAGVTVDTQLRDEILALQEEMAEYDISFFDLADCSPKAAKTRRSCADLVRAMFEPPPPLTGELRKTGKLPVSAILARTGLPKKIAERHRKYLVASTLILDGDYPGLADYLSYMKKGGSFHAGGSR